MNARFVVRGTLLSLTIVGLAVVAVLLINRGKQLPLEATPPRPTITAPRGVMPAGPVSLTEWTKYGSDVYHAVGHGFVVRLANGDLVGVTTAHSLSFSTLPPLEQIALAVSGEAKPAIEFDTLRGEPGTARSGEDMTVDYVLLQAPKNAAIDPQLILSPDPRGLPQPGERVSIYTAVNNQPRVFEGTVQSAGDQAVWVLMDGAFDPSGMSGSPFVSQYTGQVIGMAIATTHRADRVLLGLHPIGSIVRKAEAVSMFPKIADYRR